MLVKKCAAPKFSILELFSLIVWFGRVKEKNNNKKTTPAADDSWNAVGRGLSRSALLSEVQTLVPSESKKMSPLDSPWKRRSDPL